MVVDMADPAFPVAVGKELGFARGPVEFTGTLARRGLSGD
jgi:hypothetical protein